MSDKSVKQFDPKQISDQDQLTMTQAAVDHFKRRIAKRGKGCGIRLTLKKYGCTGFAYVFDIIDHVDPNDINTQIIEEFALSVDPLYFWQVRGSRIDYMKKGLNWLVVVDNPNAKGECGCGESFTTEE